MENCYGKTWKTAMEIHGKMPWKDMENCHGKTLKRSDYDATKHVDRPSSTAQNITRCISVSLFFRNFYTTKVSDDIWYIVDRAPELIG